MQNLIILDISAAVLLMVLANLSMRLGAALKIRPYYKLFHLSTALILLASFISVIAQSLPSITLDSFQRIIPGALRCIAGIVATGTALRYWKWLFAEYLKR